MMKKWFESVIWSSRLIVIVAVISSLLAAVALFYMATVDAWHMVVHLLNYASPDLTTQQRMELRAESITHVVEMVDGFLLATVMLIFGMGLYELFISKIDQAERSAVASSVLVIDSLDDLKARLAKVILMILIVRYFEYALQMKLDGMLDLLYFSMGIVFLSAGLWISHLADKKEH